MATTPSIYQDLRVDWRVQDKPAVIADLIKETGLLQTSLVLPSSHGDQHEYKRFNSLPSATFRNFGSGIVPVSFSKDMETLKLWEVGILMEVDAGKADAYPGGVETWFDNNIPATLAGIGQDISKQVWYGTVLIAGTTYYSQQDGFIGLHQYVKANSNVVAQLGGTTASRYSLFAVRWEDVSGTSLRVYPNANGELVTVEDYGRYMAVTNTTTGAKQPVYGRYVKAYMSLVVPAKKAAAAITQIDGTHLPTAPQIDSLVNAVRGSGQIYIYGNDDAIAAITALKYAKGQTDLGSANGINNMVTSWNNVPVILDNNLVSTETTTLD